MNNIEHICKVLVRLKSSVFFSKQSGIPTPRAIPFWAPCKRNRGDTCARARDNDDDNGDTRKSGIRRREKICSVERNTRRDRTVINVILLLLSRVPVWRVYRVAGDKLRVGRYYFSYGRHGHTNAREIGFGPCVPAVVRCGQNRTRARPLQYDSYDGMPARRQRWQTPLRCEKNALRYCLHLHY